MAPVTLRDYCPAEHLANYDAALDKIREAYQPARLSIVTMGPPTLDPCSGTMVCGCQSCVKDRVSRTSRDVRQPWMPRPSRRAA